MCCPLFLCHLIIFSRVMRDICLFLFVTKTNVLFYSTFRTLLFCDKYAIEWELCIGRHYLFKRETAKL
ncbi:hypothetical protein K450DRAFT_259682 [Umbelopsis ramanniana AG]|uniref:Uncharacterized protein n=1 Tax=Umbelopsis ramanniana AG TaxID=1314678 RepID=A0AAD5E358_UMBRA|nr:uncharacterized protein K450DRAFT_259682 [Umbelopsis ramanniana AG]KAI8575889.1 hypothetical protein K450DRAFT_259682 [Umbelopsis ramanniana AG]